MASEFFSKPRAISNTINDFKNPMTFDIIPNITKIWCCDTLM